MGIKFQVVGAWLVIIFVVGVVTIPTIKGLVIAGAIGVLVGTVWAVSTATE